MNRLREFLRRWLDVPEPHWRREEVQRQLLEETRAEAMRAQALYRRHDAREELRVLSQRLDALTTALGIQVVGAPAGTDAEASITVLNDADLRNARLTLDAEVLVRELRRLSLIATRDARRIAEAREKLPKD